MVPDPRDKTEKEVEDIMDSMKKIYESGNDRRVKFVAINWTDLPSFRDQSAADNNNDRHLVRHLVAILEIEMAELLTSKVYEVTVEPPRPAPVAIASPLTSSGTPPTTSKKSSCTSMKGGSQYRTYSTTPR